MTLSFSQAINGKPNYFIEKIWAGIPNADIDIYDLCVMDHRIRFGKPWDYYSRNCDPADLGLPPFFPKLHTIRRDSDNRWKPGQLIHPVINNRTKNRFQFAGTFPCLSIQTIETNNRFGAASFEIIIDGKIFAQKHYGHDHDKNAKGLEELAFNDGFDRVDDFVKYFQNFKGKIIHWTSLKY